MKVEIELPDTDTVLICGAAHAGKWAVYKLPESYPLDEVGKIAVDLLASIKQGASA